MNSEGPALEPTGFGGTAEQRLPPSSLFGGAAGTPGVATSAQVSELRAELTSLRHQFAEALQAGLNDVATRTEARLNQLAAAVDDRVVGRLEAAAADLRRTLNVALEVQVDSAAITQAAALDTRSALESRSVVLEEALGDLAERVEVLNREGSDDTRQQLRTLGADLAILRQSTDPVEALRRRAEAQSRLEAALDARHQHLAEAVGELLAAVTAERVTTRTKLLQLEDTTSRILDTLLPLEDRFTVQAAEVAAHWTDLLVGLHEGFDAIRVAVGGQLGRMRKELSAELSAAAVNAALAVEGGERDRAAMLERLGEHRNALIARMDKLGDRIVTADELPHPRVRAAGGVGRPAQPAAAASPPPSSEALFADLRSDLGRLTAVVEALARALAENQSPPTSAVKAGARSRLDKAAGEAVPTGAAPASKTPRKSAARPASTSKPATESATKPATKAATKGVSEPPAARPPTPRKTPTPRVAAAPTSRAKPSPTPRVPTTRSQSAPAASGVQRQRPSDAARVFRSPTEAPPVRPSPRASATRAPEDPAEPVAGQSAQRPDETDAESMANRRLFPFRRY